jgi:5-methylcytosine-specific restriction endonuclease McrA
MKVFERDGGVCLKCGISTPKMELVLSDLFYHQRDAWELMWGMLHANGYSQNRKNGLWDADHIQAVTEGGGACGLDNYRTLCIPCHKDETRKLHKRMAAARRAGQDPHSVPHGVEWSADEVEVAKQRMSKIVAALGSGYSG